MSAQTKIIVALVLLAGALGNFLYIQSLRHDLKTAKTERDTALSNYSHCIINQNKNFEVSNDYQIQLAALHDHLATSEQLRKSARCVPVETARRSDAAIPDQKLSGRGGLTVGYIRDLAARCDADRLKGMALQRWIGN